jgi:phosphate transport system permease protein
LATTDPLIPTHDIHAALRRRPLRRVNEVVIVGFIALCATVSLGITGLIIYELFNEARGFFEDVSLTRFLFTDDRWQPVIGEGEYRIWDLVSGTLNVVVWALLFAVPIGLATAVYLSEYANPRVRKTLKPILEALAGVPTVVYAFFALTFITPNLLQPLLGSDSIKNFNALGASLMLAVMVLPTIASISEDAMSNVPRELREGAYALGSTRLEVAFRVVFPAALSGIIASVLLAIARVIGETMIVAVAAGSTPRLSLNPLDSVQTMTGYMLQIGLGDAQRGTAQYTSLFAVGFSLFAMTFVTNLVALWFVRRYREEYE